MNYSRKPFCSMMIILSLTACSGTNLFGLNLSEKVPEATAPVASVAPINRDSGELDWQSLIEIPVTAPSPSASASRVKQPVPAPSAKPSGEIPDFLPQPTVRPTPFPPTSMEQGGQIDGSLQANCPAVKFFSSANTEVPLRYTLKVQAGAVYQFEINVDFGTAVYPYISDKPNVSQKFYRYNGWQFIAPETGTYYLALERANESNSSRGTLEIISQDDPGCDGGPEPTPKPTAKPTARPTPSASPTPEPTVEPTVTPTTTPMPPVVLPKIMLANGILYVPKSYVAYKTASNFSQEDPSKYAIFRPSKDCPNNQDVSVSHQEATEKAGYFKYNVPSQFSGQIVYVAFTSRISDATQNWWAGPWLDLGSGSILTDITIGKEILPDTCRGYWLELNL